MDNRRGLVIHVTADAPPGKARATVLKSRTEYWENGKRMPQGGLVAVVTKNKPGTNSSQCLDIAIATLSMSKSYLALSTTRC